MKITFADFFGLPSEVIEEYGAYNVPLVQDVPLFIDPFLLFYTQNEEYQRLHAQIILYVAFLKRQSLNGPISEGLLKAWFYFPEVKQTWLGFTQHGNNGRGLGRTFANSLTANFSCALKNFGEEEISQESHLEKLSLLKSGVGRDGISDFTTNLIKGFLCSYTEQFAMKHLSASQTRKFFVNRVVFDHESHAWKGKEYLLPAHGINHVLLVPRDILTRDDTWINHHDLIHDFSRIQQSIDNDALRGLIDDYFNKVLPTRATYKQYEQAVEKVLQKFPEILDYYIRYKEDKGEIAIKNSKAKVTESEFLFHGQARHLVDLLETETSFYSTPTTSLEQSRERAKFLKHVIEDKDGYRLFYRDGQPLTREEDVHTLFKLTWYATDYDVNAEVNNGRGPVDFKVSKGAKDSTLVEFKIASNRQLRRNLEKQTKVYEKANQTKSTIRVIAYFTREEEVKLNRILKELKLEGNQDIITIDARRDNKPSGSKA